jgi:hypothetical protein
LENDHSEGIEGERKTEIEIELSGRRMEMALNVI